MYQNDEDYSIPNEQQIYQSFDCCIDDLSKLRYLYNYQNKYLNKHIYYLSFHFSVLEIKSKDIQNMNIHAACLYKLVEEQKSQIPHLMTKILGILQNKLQQLPQINELHIAFLKSCIISYNYKIAYQFIKSKIFLHGNYLDNKNNLFIQYFYFAGVIAQAQQDFDEALRCYKLAYKISPQNEFSFEAEKMESLLRFRLGLELRNSSNIINQFVVNKLSDLISEKDQLDRKEREFNLSDSNLQICLKEWSQQALLYQFLQTESELHSKVSFDLLLFHLKIQNQDVLIEYLLQINKIHNMLSINEEKRYIEFRYNNLTYKQINSKLENRINLIQQLESLK
ncbi:unnamed protein product [Paramecium sonneborni]|uniref:Tetratricopeptide repeat protein n=1 Tax=Paramecium sonneborni TaxID=65129 RepID=A0A8S1NUC5_9CILI|nr:unnamed protein product [Paramecium sonneborni]